MESQVDKQIGWLDPIVREHEPAGRSAEARHARARAVLGDNECAEVAGLNARVDFRCHKQMLRPGSRIDPVAVEVLREGPLERPTYERSGSRHQLDRSLIRSAQLNGARSGWRRRA